MNEQVRLQLIAEILHAHEEYLLKLKDWELWHHWEDMNEYKLTNNLDHARRIE